MSPCVLVQCKSFYGKVSRGGRTIGAHRAAYEDAYGPIPPGQVVRHKCDNGRCINPEHLELGTQADNIRDRQKRGRFAHIHGDHLRKYKGAVHGMAKLSSEDVRWIRWAYSYSGATYAAIGRAYGVTPEQTSNIVRGLQRRSG